MDRNFLIAIAVLIAGFIGLAIVTGGGDSAETDNPRGEAYAQAINETPLEVVEGDHVTGGGELTIIEYGDFQCPVCGALHPQMVAIKNAYPDQVKVVYRHFPLDSIHPKAKSAHIASEAAGLQGKFWEMHDLLFEQQSVWTESNNVRDTMVEFAEQLGLDVAQFETDYDDPATRDFIQSAFKAGGEQGVRSTPTVYIDGEQYGWNQVNVALIGELLGVDDSTTTDEPEAPVDPEAAPAQ